MEFIFVRGYCQANQPCDQGLVKLLWQILQIGNASRPPTTSARLSSMGHAEIQTPTRAQTTGRTVAQAHCAHDVAFGLSANPLLGRRLTQLLELLPHCRRRKPALDQRRIEGDVRPALTDAGINDAKLTAHACRDYSTATGMSSCLRIFFRSFFFGWNG